MDTIRAVAQLAEAREGSSPREASGGRRKPARTSLASPDVEAGLAASIDVLAELGMRPTDDRATQTRLAAATDRAHAARLAPADVAPAIMRDYMLQEAAAARLSGTGRMDPLAAISDPASRRNELGAASRLKDMAGIQAHLILDRATASDMSAIAAGRYDAITGGNTSFAVSTQLRMSAETLTAPAGAAAFRETAAKGPAMVATAPSPNRSAAR